MSRQFRFSIRSILVLTAIASLFYAFPISRLVKQAAAWKWVAQQGGHVTFSHKFDRKPKSYDHTAQLIVSSWLVSLFGVDLFDWVEHVILDNQTVGDLGPITGFPRLRTLAISIEIDRDLDFSPLTGLKRLEVLDLQYTGICERRFRELRELLPNVSVTTDSFK